MANADLLADARNARDKAHENYLRDRRAEHAKELLGKIGGMTITGLRLSDPKNAANGLVVTLTNDEAAQVVVAVAKILKQRVA